MCIRDRSKAANLQCMFHRTNTRKRRSTPKSLMDPQHLAEGSFPKDEKSVYEPFLCKHVQLHWPAIHRKQIAVHAGHFFGLCALCWCCLLYTSRCV